MSVPGKTKRLRPGDLLISVCLLCPKLVFADPTTIVTAIFGPTQAISQVGLSERWSVHPVPKFKERNLEQGIGIRFLDSKRALVNFVSKAWEQTTIIGHKDNSPLYCFNEEATYIVSAADVFEILAEEVVCRKEEKELPCWYADMVVIVQKEKGKFDGEVRPLGFEVSLTRIMRRLAEKGVPQHSGKGSRPDKDAVRPTDHRSLITDYRSLPHPPSSGNPK